MRCSNKLIHILPKVEVARDLLFAVDIVKELSDYSHLFLFDNQSIKLNDCLDTDLIGYLQSSGASVVIADDISDTVISKEDPSGIILYNITNRKMQTDVPMLYYSCGKADTDLVKQSAAIVSATSLNNDTLKLTTDILVPPTSGLKALANYSKSKNSIFTVGLLSTVGEDKYPDTFVIELLDKLASDGLADQLYILLTTTDKFRHPGTQFAIDTYANKHRLVKIPIKVTAGLYYISKCDAIIQATTANHTEQYSRTTVEAMAFGRPVICENKGCFPFLFESDRNVILYDNVGEVIDGLYRLVKDTDFRNDLILNAQLRASWEDIRIHAGKFKSALRMIGA